MLGHSKVRRFVGGAAVAAVAAFTIGPLTAQERSEAAGGAARDIPRTADGRPDLQGIFSYASATPLQRPPELKDKAVLTEAEAAEYVKQQLARREQADSARPQGSVGGYNQFWYEFGTSVTPDRRTSLIIDPPDGRLPPRTPEGERRMAAHRAMLQRPAEGPEDRDVSERCILGYNSGPPMVPAGYNQMVQIVQTPQYVVIFTEMVHTVRIVPLDGRPHPAGDQRPWSGDSRGRWEGDTLVIETRNFSEKNWNQFSGWNWGASEDMHLVERLTRVDANTVNYQFTVTDPTIWTKPWTAIVPLRNTGERMYEYACHEGNYGLEGILRGARSEERAR
jgi:hypothetical protein